MSTITTRASKGGPLTWAEADANFDNLNTDKVETSSLATGVATALGVAVGSAGAFVTNGGALGTPSSGVGTNLTGTAAGLTAGNVTTNANLTGHVTSTGNAAVLGSFTHAQLNTAVSDANLAAAGANGDITSLTAVTAITTTGGIDIIGTNTNDAAAAGYIGEYIESVVGSTSAPTTAQYGDLTSVSLTAGDWDVSAIAYLALNGATMTVDNGPFIGVSSTSGNATTGLVEGDSWAGGPNPTSGVATNFVIPTKRISLAVTTTYYLKMKCAYSAGTPKFYGRLSARRVR